MRHPAARLAIVAAALLLSTTAIAAESAKPAAPTGMARFTSHERFVDAKISPKGTWLALVTVESGRRTLVFLNLADRKIGSKLGASGRNMVGRYAWANDERVVAEVWQQDGVLARPSSAGELLSINPERADARFIYGYRVGRDQYGSHIKRAETAWASAHLVDTLRHDDQHVLIETRQWEDVGDTQTWLAKLDVYTGLKADVASSPVANARFLTDENGEPRLAYALAGDARLRFFLRDTQGAWRPVQGLPGLRPQSDPWSFRASDGTLSVVEPVPGGFDLVEVAIDSGSRRPISRTKVAEPSAVLTDWATGKVVAVESHPDLPDWQVVDASHPLAQVLDGLLDASPGQHVRLVSRTEDQKKAVAWVYGDRQPGRLLLVDVAKRTAEVVAETRPWIKPEAMAEMSAFHIKASDGLPIHGYLTYPPGLADGAKAPLVVLPHGGPFGVRDTWGFDPEVQLLASEGFAVLQVNYRGSGGYGEAFQEAGYRHWGDRMIEDLLDATRWAVKKGRVDGTRMCTYGASYGGYAALQATILAPELFRCAVGYAGVYDLTKLEKNDDIVTSRTTRAYVRTTAGDDEAALRDASPVFHADRIKVPVLLAHGAEDTRVPIAHAEKLRDALTKLGRPPEWLVEPAEGHGFYDEGARLRLYTRLVAFLKKHTAPPVTPPSAPAP
jgi:dipeptidyl aminopeptidase/acylaminoacyl peptidase